MPTITLDDIRDAIHAKYQPLLIDMGEAGVCELRQAMRLPETDRKAIAEAQKALSDTEDETEIRGYLQDIIYIAASDQRKAQALLAWADELVVLVEIVQKYAEVSQVGEASPSGS